MLTGLKIAVVVAISLALTACDAPPTKSARPGKPLESSCRVSRVVDGDTIHLACPGQPILKARLLGFDTPEVFSPRCQQEAALGHRATAFLRRQISNASTIRFGFHGHDRYGRELVQMRLDGTDIARIMVSQGLAVRYNGARRINWCDRLNGA